MTASWISAQATDRGRRKSGNEDSLYADDQQGYFVICDGMGGHGGGDIASAATVEVLIQENTHDSSTYNAILKANQRLLDLSSQGIGAPQMGTTVVAVRLQDNGLYEVHWVGDSRAYRVGKESIELLTEDHAFAYRLMKAGLISEAELKEHPYRSVLLQSIGGGSKQVYPSKVEGFLKEDEKILLCSDGLTGELEDEEILSIIQSNDSLQQAVDQMLQKALAHGGHDNISLILVQPLGIIS